jgi:hypothetical protein
MRYNCWVLKDNPEIVYFYLQHYGWQEFVELTVSLLENGGCLQGIGRCPSLLYYTHVNSNA